MKPIVQLRNVTKYYGASRGVEDISLEVPKGTVFGFLGPNGAGKTTTISMLVDLIRPSAGTIRLFGLDSVQDSLAIRGRVGFLAGDMALDRGLTGWQQLEYMGNLRGSFDRKYVAELAQRLDCRLERKFKTLSRGNKQKVGLIAALMHKPELLILDEPTSGLDPLMQAEFNKIILERQRAGATAFISSHVLSEVQEVCDQVTFIRSGKLIATRPVHDIAADAPKLFKVTGAPSDLKQKLSQLPGLNIGQTEKDLLTGTYHGDINLLIREVSKHKVLDFSIESADLEEAFMKYYEEENA